MRRTSLDWTECVGWSGHSAFLAYTHYHFFFFFFFFFCRPCSVILFLLKYKHIKNTLDHTCFPRINPKAEWEKVPSDMSAQQSLKSACASAQSDQSFCCQHEETLLSWLSKNAPREDFDQTTQMHRLIWIFSGRTCPTVRFPITNEAKFHHENIPI